MSTESDEQSSPPDASPDPPPTWTYPTRFCRICREDVAPTVTMYPPGVPPRFQRPVVEYKNEDEYGRLLKPCRCTGSMRYIHELCLLRSRTENRREGSMWKCHTCGYRFNFQRLSIQRFLSSKYSSGVLTIITMVLLMFMLGFVADPIINLYVDPYETLLGEQDVWDEITLRAPGSRLVSAWTQHFVKGMVSMGLVGFIKTVLLNPLNWLNIRHNLGMTSTRTTSTGRDRAINISWVAVLIGVVSAFYFFYQWMQTVIQIGLKRATVNIVDTQLPGDDDDLKPPPGFESRDDNKPDATGRCNQKMQNDTQTPDTLFSAAAKFRSKVVNDSRDLPSETTSWGTEKEPQNSVDESDRPSLLTRSMPGEFINEGRSSALNVAHDQGWSFSSS